MKKKLNRFKQLVKEYAELALKYNSSSSTVGKVAIEQLADLERLN